MCVSAEVLLAGKHSTCSSKKWLALSNNTPPYNWTYFYTGTGHCLMWCKLFKHTTLYKTAIYLRVVPWYLNINNVFAYSHKERENFAERHRIYHTFNHRLEVTSKKFGFKYHIYCWNDVFQELISFHYTATQNQKPTLPVRRWELLSVISIQHSRFQHAFPLYKKEKLFTISKVIVNIVF